MVSASDRIADGLTTQAINLQRAGEGIIGPALAELNRLYNDITQQIVDANVAGLSRESDRYHRLVTLQAQVKASVERTYGKIDKTISGEMRELADVAQTGTINLLNNVVSADLFGAPLTRRDLESIVKTSLVQGSPASDWWKKQSADLQFRFQQEMNKGLLAGETVDQLVRRVRGTQTGYRIVEVNGKDRKLRVFSGGVMEASTREATALVRTYALQVSNNTIFETYQGNDDLVRGIQTVVTLDNRTTLICIGWAGGAWDLKTGEPLPESEVDKPFPGIPPYHFQCRTVLAPILKSWEDLIEASTGKRLKLLDGVPDSERASIDGRIAGNTTFDEWLKTKTEDEQIEILGSGRQRLWKDGKITLAQLTDQSGRPLTIAQLRIMVGERPPVSTENALRIRSRRMAPADAPIPNIPGATKVWRSGNDVYWQDKDGKIWIQYDAMKGAPAPTSARAARKASEPTDTAAQARPVAPVAKPVPRESAAPVQSARVIEAEVASFQAALDDIKKSTTVREMAAAFKRTPGLSSIKIEPSVFKLNHETVRDVLSGVMRSASAAGDWAKDAMVSLKAIKVEGEGIAAFNSGTGTLRLGSAFQDREALRSSLAYSKEIGELVSGDIPAVLIHETTHVLDTSLTSMISKKAGAPQAARDAWDDLSVWIRNRRSKLAKAIGSEYAGLNDIELRAEMRSYLTQTPEEEWVPLAREYARRWKKSLSEISTALQLERGAAL